jgi:predicted DNA-binding protein YlxM (UPF0122 family)
MARPTKFTAEMVNKLELLYLRGFTDQEAAEILDITKQTIHNWKKRHPQFFDSAGNWKAAADDRVEQALYEQALNGSVRAQQFWLKNRRKEQWRDQQHVRHSGTVNDLSDLTDEELAERRAALRSALKDTDE